MRRRARAGPLLALSLGLAGGAWGDPGESTAQTARVFRLGFLSARADPNPAGPAFIAEMRALGDEQGRNLAVVLARLAFVGSSNFAPEPLFFREIQSVERAAGVSARFADYEVLR